jgi:cysteinyl-tRNA synthetase
MSAHYKQPLDWSDKLINDCQNTLDKWYRIYSSDIKSVQLTEEVLKPLHEDLNTPGYIANLHQLYEKANKGEDKELFISACKFIGLFNENIQQWEKYKKDKATISESEINSKIDLRDKARANKDYSEADRIRDELLNKGVLIEDKDGKTLWKFK